MSSKRPSFATTPKSVPTKRIGASSVPLASHAKRTRSLCAVHGAGEAEAIGGKPLLNSLHHHVDTVVTVAAAMWIDVISSAGPSVGNEGVAAPRIPLVPSGEIAIDHLSDVTFSKRVHVNAPFVRGSTPAGMIPRD